MTRRTLSRLAMLLLCVFVTIFIVACAPTNNNGNNPPQPPGIEQPDGGEPDDGESDSGEPDGGEPDDGESDSEEPDGGEPDDGGDINLPGGDDGGVGNGQGIGGGSQHQDSLHWIERGSPQTVNIPSDYWIRNNFNNPFLDPVLTANAVEANIRAILPQALFEELFPNRFGVGGWFGASGQVASDYFSYDNLIQAVRFLSDIIVISEMRMLSADGLMTPYPGGVLLAWTERVTVIHRSNPTVGVVIQVGDQFHESWNVARPVYTTITSFGRFLSYYLQADRIHAYREMAAFFANLTQETSGGTPGQESRLTHGLWFNEEIAYAGADTSTSYTQMGHYFPPMAHPSRPGVLNSYHGRGGIQLSWNFNYGISSGIYFGDARILLERPELIITGGNINVFGTSRHISGGVLGWMTSISFWMLPQRHIPSAHQVMRGEWSANQADIGSGRHTGVDIGASQESFGGSASQGDYHSIGFAMTVMIINGGFEQNLSITDTRLWTRAHMYVRVAQRLQSLLNAPRVYDAVATEKLNTLRMFSF